MQRPPSPLHFLALHSEDARKSHLFRSVSTPEESLSSYHPSSTPLVSPPTAINADSQVNISLNGMAESAVKVSGDPLTLFRTTSLPLASPTENTVPSKSSQNTQTNRSTHLFFENTVEKRENTEEKRENKETLAEKKRYTVGLMSELRAQPRPGSTGTPAGSAASGPSRRALFTNLASRTPVRRAKSEGHVQVAVASAEHSQSPVPEVCTDATMNDRLWSKLDPGSHRDSMSSSSSISSSDTVIDLSLPNLARKSLTSLPTTSDPRWVSCRRSTIASFDVLRVSKSKSNPNLQQGECPKDELQPRPLQQSQDSPDSPSRLTQRRHTWNRLYVEGLKQSSANRTSSPVTTTTATTSMSKSLGDLTSDDISCNFDSKYRSISRSFIVRPTRDQLRRGSPQKLQPSNNLTEQLRKLTDVEPLTASDFAPEKRPSESQEDPMDETLVRRTSSRSQSRVRYIANRAKKAQERQRLQSLIQGRSASFSLTDSFGSGSNASPIEERGNPEGACCVARSPCSSLDLLSQLAPLESPSTRQFQTSPDPENSEVFFMLKL